MFTTLIAISFSPILIYLYRYRLLITPLFISIVFFLVASNAHNHDFEAYQLIFDNPAFFVEPGYALLVDILTLLGFNSHRSVLFVFAITIFVTLSRIIKLSIYFFLWIYLYFIFLLPLDITQIRFGIASFIFFNAVISLSKKKKLESTLLALVGISFHVVLLIPSLILLLSMANVSNSIRSAFTLILFLFSILFFEFVFPFLVNSGFQLRTLLSYVSYDIKPFSLVVWCLPIASTIFLFRHLEGDSTIKDCKAYTIYTLIVNFSIISLGFSAGLIYLHEFNRIYRLVLMLLFFSGVILLGNLKAKQRLCLYYYLVALSGALGLFYAFSLNYDYIYWGVGIPRTNIIE